MRDHPAARGWARAVEREVRPEWPVLPGWETPCGRGGSGRAGRTRRARGVCLCSVDRRLLDSSPNPSVPGCPSGWSFTVAGGRGVRQGKITHNDECLMTNDEGLTNDETRMANAVELAILFVIRYSSFLRHSALDIRLSNSCQRTRTCAGVAVPVVPSCWTVIDATRLPNAAAAAKLRPAATAVAIPALALSPAPTGSIGPRTGYAGTTATSAPGFATNMPCSPRVQKTGRSRRSASLRR